MTVKLTVEEMSGLGAEAGVRAVFEENFDPTGETRAEIGATDALRRVILKYALDDVQVLGPRHADPSSLKAKVFKRAFIDAALAVHRQKRAGDELLKKLKHVSYSPTCTCSHCEDYRETLGLEQVKARMARKEPK